MHGQAAPFHGTAAVAIALHVRKPAPARLVYVAYASMLSHTNE